MKKTLLSILVCLGFGLSLMAQNGKTPFKGTIKYKLTYASEQLDPNILAQQPNNMTVKISDTKLLMNAQMAKIVLNADEKKAYNMINLSQMGLGKYVIVQTEADIKANKDVDEYVINKTEETKTIQGYTAKKATGSYITPMANISFEVYYVENFCPEFLSHVENSFVDLGGFPLEYTITTKDNTKGVTIVSNFAVESMTAGEIEASEFNISKSYKPTTEDDLETIIEDFMQAFQE